MYTAYVQYSKYELVNDYRSSLPNYHKMYSLVPQFSPNSQSITNRKCRLNKVRALFPKVSATI